MMQKWKAEWVIIAIGVILLTLRLSTSVSAQASEESSVSQVFLPLISNTTGTAEQSHNLDAAYDYIVIEGDILVPVDYFDVQASSMNGAFTYRLWPDGIVPYEFSSNVTPENRQRMVEAMALWEQAATIDFVHCPLNLCLLSLYTDYIFIRDAPTNQSPVGRNSGGQPLDIKDWDIRYVLAHELGHALGFWHEHSRRDRDTYISINWNNVESDPNAPDQPSPLARGALGITTEGINEYGPYDFDSVMHYSQCAYAKGLICALYGINPTITVLAPNQEWQRKIGKLDNLSTEDNLILSTMDKLTMSFLYPQPNWRFVDINSGLSLQTGTFLAPYANFVLGVAWTPQGGTLWVQPGTYVAAGTYSKPMTIQAPLGNVELR